MPARCVNAISLVAVAIAVACLVAYANLFVRARAPAELAAAEGDERVARGGHRARAGEVGRARVRRQGHRRRQGLASRAGPRLPPLRPPRRRRRQVI
jgi:hypothetical protein